MSHPRILCLLTLALLGAAPLAAQTPPGAALQRRAQLEQQLIQRFVQRAAQELELAPAARPRLARIVSQSALDRRQLNQQLLQLRRRMVLAVQDAAVTDAAFEALLVEQRRLRERDHELWTQEQQQLEEILSPRQRAHFTLLWLRLQEDARNLLRQRRPPADQP